jgi:hypothetical protein
MRAYPRADQIRSGPPAGKGSPPWPRPALREREIGTFSGGKTSAIPSGRDRRGRRAHR